MRRVAALLLLLGCGPSQQRDQSLLRLQSPSAKERAAAVRALGQTRPRDDQSWAALGKAARDGSAAVRAEAAAAMAAAQRDDAPDGISALLRDPEDAVRIAAVRALRSRCGERSAAFLRLAFAHSGAPVRVEVVEALVQCGQKPEEMLAHEEAERRRKALILLGNPVAAQKARGARELGLLCRDQDKARLLPLLDEGDGVAVAAAARALGDCGAQDSAPRLAALLDEGGEISAAAAEALLALGPSALGPARAKLAKLAALDSDEALPAAAALASDPQAPPGEVCAAALAARRAQAAAMLASGCPAGPFARALERARSRDPFYEALLKTKGPASELEKPLSQILRAGGRDARLPRLALRYRAGGAALVEVLRREQAARAAQLAQRRRAEDDEGSAAEIARTPAAGVPDKARYARLMARLQERAGAEGARASAAERLDALLHGDAQAEQREFIAGALRAALALKAPGAGKVAKAWANDPDARIAAAARGEPEPAAPPAEKPCFTGACLVALADQPAPPEAAREPARAAIWSDEGSVRAAACTILARLRDASSEAPRRTLAADPEQRVRVACGPTNETAARK